MMKIGWNQELSELFLLQGKAGRGTDEVRRTSEAGGLASMPGAAESVKALCGNERPAAACSFSPLHTLNMKRAASAAR